MLGDLRVPGLIPQAMVTMVASIMDAHKGQLYFNCTFPLHSPLH